MFYNKRSTSSWFVWLWQSHACFSLLLEYEIQWVLIFGFWCLINRLLQKHRAHSNRYHRDLLYRHNVRLFFVSFGCCVLRYFTKKLIIVRNYMWFLVRSLSLAFELCHIKYFVCTNFMKIHHFTSNEFLLLCFFFFALRNVHYVLVSFKSRRLIFHWILKLKNK